MDEQCFKPLNSGARYKLTDASEVAAQLCLRGLSFTRGGFGCAPHRLGASVDRASTGNLFPARQRSIHGGRGDF